MVNPILVEVTRGQRVESFHRGAMVITDSDGKILTSIGDVDIPLFPRSALKPFQALYMMESGSADAYNFTAADIALTCASHDGEIAHTAGVTTMLAKAGLTHTCLDCGAQWPAHPKDRSALIKADQAPSVLHNNCSGKHAGIIAACKHLGEPIVGYCEPSHIAQKEIKAILEDITAFKLDDTSLQAIDGCALPTYAFPLKNLAMAFAKFGSGEGLSKSRSSAAERIYQAYTQEPYLVGGTNRFCTKVTQSLAGEAIVKTGAEGVFAAVIKEKSLGIIVKCDDGGTRASEAIMAGVLKAVMGENEALKTYLNKPLKNRNGNEIGRVRVNMGILKELI